MTHRYYIFSRFILTLFKSNLVAFLSLNTVINESNVGYSSSITVTVRIGVIKPLLLTQNSSQLYQPWDNPLNVITKFAPLSFLYFSIVS